MPDDGEDEVEEREREDDDLVAEALLVETLMGWDGDACECPTCECPMFLDRPDSRTCRDCEAGNHRGPYR